MSIHKSCLNKLIPIKSSLTYIIGGINSGKTTHAKLLLNHAQYDKLILIVRDVSEWVKYKKADILQIDRPFKNLELFKQAKTNTLFLLDDYHHEKTDLDNFMKIVNFELTHRNITMIINVHSIYHSHLFSHILCNQFLFLTYSPINTKIIKLLDNTYSLNFKSIFTDYLNRDTFDVGFLNLSKAIYIPKSSDLFCKKILFTKMFKSSSNIPYHIIKSDNVNIESNDNIIQNSENNFIEQVKNIYKNKTRINILAKNMYIFFNKMNALSDTYQIILPNNKITMNLLDLISSSQNPNPNKILNKQTKQTLQFMKNNIFICPRLLIKNKNFYKYIT